MTDYIEREAAKRAIQRALNDGTGYGEALSALPAADVQKVVHAYWKAVDIGDGDLFYECSHCGEGWTLIDGTPKENNMEYCNRCGATMDAIYGR